jgi:hypothetical protein
MVLTKYSRAQNCRRAFAAGASLLVISAVAHAADNEVKVTLYSGADYSSGDYGAALDTEIFYVPVSAKAAIGEWSFRVSSGYINIKGPGGVIGGGDSGVIVAPDRRDMQIVEESGIGDTYFTLMYSPVFKNGDIFLDLSTKVKAPTASESKGLGTGKMDVTVKADISKFIGPVLPFASLGYRFVGQPDSFTLNDTLIASAGAAYYFSNKASIGASYDYREAASSLAEDSKEIFAYFDVKATKKWGIVFYGVAGLSEGSPDFGAGVQLKMRAY